MRHKTAHSQRNTRRQYAMRALLAGCAIALSIPCGGAQQPNDGNGAYRTGHYRNLFAERGYSPQSSHAKIEATFQQLFHGDPQTQSVYFESGSNSNGPLAYITDWANNDARTEGMSYGMMIAVELNHQHEFDALWNWAHAYMLITDPQNPSVGYFAWSMNTDGTPRSAGPAPDGEEYFTMALYFAAHRWGNGAGIYNYKAEADKILSGMRHHPVLTGTSPFRIHPGDAPFLPPDHPWPSPNHTAAERHAAASGEKLPPMHVNRAPYKESIGPMMDEAHTMIRFVPNVTNTTTDPSYHLPAFYELWARWGPVEDRDFWAHAAEVSRQLFVNVTGPDTALTPDRVNFDLTPVIERDGQSVPFSYDSWRSISNWSVDASWWHKSAAEPQLSRRYQSFLVTQGIHTFVDRYTLDGKPLSQRHSTGMVATAAVGSLALNRDSNANAFVDELWNTPVPTGEQRYYDGMLYLMSMMHCAGEFRVIEARPEPR